MSNNQALEQNSGTSSINKISSKWNSLSKVRKLNTSLMMLFVLILGLLPASASASDPSCRINFVVDMSASIGHTPNGGSAANVNTLKNSLKGAIDYASASYPDAEFSFSLFASKGANFIGSKGYWVTKTNAKSYVDSFKWYGQGGTDNTFPYNLSRSKPNGTNWEQGLSTGTNTAPFGVPNPSGRVFITDGNPTTDTQEQAVVDSGLTDNISANDLYTERDAQPGTEVYNVTPSSLRKPNNPGTHISDARGGSLEKATTVANAAKNKGQPIYGVYINGGEFAAERLARAQVTMPKVTTKRAYSGYNQIGLQIPAFTKEICETSQGALWSNTYAAQWDANGNYLGYDRTNDPILGNFDYSASGENKTSKAAKVTGDFWTDLSNTLRWSLTLGEKVTIAQTKTDGIHTVPYDRVCWTTAGGGNKNNGTHFEGNSRVVTNSASSLDKGVYACNFVQAKAQVDIIKTARATSSPASAELNRVKRGQNIYYHFTVKNTGTAPLNSVKVDDPLLGGVVKTIPGSLLPNKSSAFSVAYKVPANAPEGALRNTATVSGQPINKQGNAVSTKVTDTDPAIVNVDLVQKFDFEKTGNKRVVKPGNTVEYTFSVKNTGEDALPYADINDSTIGFNGRIPGPIAVGQTKSIKSTYKLPANYSGDTFVNTATATVPNLPVKTDDFTVYVPNIKLDKVLVEPGTSTIVHNLKIGQSYTYQFTVTNTAGTELRNVTVTDADLAQKLGLSSLELNVGTLAKDASKVVTKQFTLTEAIANRIDPAKNPSAEYENIATAEGTAVDPISGNVTSDKVTDTDPHTVTLNRTLDFNFEKSVSPGVARAGDTVTYTFKVTNTGQAILPDATIVDDTIGFNGTVSGPIAVGASKSITTTYKIPADFSGDKFPNTATATVPGAGSKTDDAEVLVPRISLEKSGPSVIRVGDTVTYTFAVTNTGGTDLTNVVVKDETIKDLFGVNVSVPVPGTLAKNQTKTVSFTTPAVTQAIAKKISPTLESGSEFKNIADVVGYPIDPTSGSTVTSKPVTDDDDHVVTLELTTSWVFNKSVNKNVAKTGDEVTYKFEITNTGQTTLSQASINDPILGITNLLINGPIAPGETKSVNASVDLPQDLADGVDDGRVKNVATATVPDGGSQTDEAVVAIPDIKIVKDGPAKLVSGKEAKYTFAVTNTGGTALKNVKVKDDVLSNLLGETVEFTIANLAKGQTQTVSKSFDITSALVKKALASQYYVAGQGFVNLADVTGDPVDPITGTTITNNPVTDDDDHTATVETNPNIEIVKTVDKTVVQAGDEVTFTITVKNTGDSVLTNVKVTDAKLGFEETIASLPVGGSKSFTVKKVISEQDLTDNKFTNIACVETPEIPEECDEADVYEPSINVVKTSDPETVVRVGDDLRYKFVVKNTGATKLVDVKVTDADLSELLGATVSINVDDLAIGESKTVYYPASNKDAIKVDSALFAKLQAAADNNVFTNTAVAKGTPVNPETNNPVPSEEVKDEDTDDVTLTANPKLEIVKTVDKTVVQAGDEVTFTITVKNTGDVDLTNVVVTDAKLPGFPKTISIAAGQTSTITAKYIVTEQDLTNGKFTNIACVETPGIPEECDEADVYEASIELTKSGPNSAVLGDTVTYNFTVKNTGAVPLTDIKITDDTFSKLFPAGVVDKINLTVPGTLAPGQVSAPLTAKVKLDKCITKASKTTCYDSVDIFGDNGEFKNIAEVVGTPVDPTTDQPVPGETVTDDDDHVINQIDWTITKVANVPATVPGESITYTITVKNTGKAVIPSLVVTDYLTTDGQISADGIKLGTITNFAPGQVKEYTYTVTVPESYTGTSFVNQADACYITVCKDGEVTVGIAAIQIIKSANTDVAEEGDTVRYSFEVKNIGGVTIDPNPVIDSIFGEIGDPDILKPGESQILTYDYEVPEGLASLLNVAIVTAPVPGNPGVEISDDDEHTLTVTSVLDAQGNPEPEFTLPTDVGGISGFNSALPFTGSMAERVAKTAMWMLTFGALGIFASKPRFGKNKKRRYSL